MRRGSVGGTVSAASDRIGTMRLGWCSGRGAAIGRSCGRFTRRRGVCSAGGGSGTASGRLGGECGCSIAGGEAKVTLCVQPTLEISISYTLYYILLLSKRYPSSILLLSKRCLSVIQALSYCYPYSSSISSLKSFNMYFCILEHYLISICISYSLISCPSFHP